MRSSCRGFWTKLSAYLAYPSRNHPPRSRGDLVVAMQPKGTCHAEGIELSVRNILTCKSIPESTLNARLGTSMEAGFELVLEALFALTLFRQIDLAISSKLPGLTMTITTHTIIFYYCNLYPRLSCTD